MGKIASSWLLLAVLCPLTGCGGTTSAGSATNDEHPPGSGGAAPLEGAAGDAPIGAGGRPQSDGAGGVTDDERTCAGAPAVAQIPPAGVYVLVDRSRSMNEPVTGTGGTWWNAMQAGFALFLDNTRSAGLSLGIQYFPSDGDAGVACSGAFASPDVELATLPDNAAALTASMAAHAAIEAIEPIEAGSTDGRPTGPALKAALEHMKAWAPKHPERKPAVVLVAAGDATTCDPRENADLAELARSALETEPQVHTVVIRLLNSGLASPGLDAIANAGGTRKAILVGGDDVNGSFARAMLGISSFPLGCSLPLPRPANPATVFDPEHVDVRFTPSATGITDHVRRLSGAGECDAAGGRGFYLDASVAPTQILLCPTLCAELEFGVLETVPGCVWADNIPK